MVGRLRAFSFLVTEPRIRASQLCVHWIVLFLYVLMIFWRGDTRPERAARRCWLRLSERVDIQRSTDAIGDFGRVITNDGGGNG